MRLFLWVSFAVLLFIAMPAQAQSNNFGRVYCGQHTACPGDPSFPPVSSLAPIANACANQYFGGSQAITFFDAASALDGNNCLSPATGAAAANGMVAQCCLVQVADHNCAFRCELNR